MRATLRRIQQEIPITIHEVPTGTQVLDWTIPDEWNIRDAWIKNSRGERVVDFRRSNLHVVNYSVPVRARMSADELKPRLHSLPDKPKWIPYRTAYYKRDWGFCVAHEDLQRVENGDYEVCIDSTLSRGSLTYGEWLIRGDIEDEFLISCHCCHPSLANDNLSGLAVAVALARRLENPRRLQRNATQSRERASPASGAATRHSYRFLFIPGTIGAITWLARNEASLSRIKHGLVLTCVGDAGNITYKKSRRGDAWIDRAVLQVLTESGAPHRVIDFSPYGYDERQYCSPGFNLPVGCFMRSQYGTFPEYHTSADNLDFIKREALEDSLEKLLRIVEAVESGSGKEEPVGAICSDSHLTFRVPRFLNLKPKGEPQLGKYGVYEALGGDVMPALWVLNFSDGEYSLADIAARSKLPFDSLAKAAHLLLSRGLIKEVGHSA